jgi:hypothetical protein
MQQTVRRPFSTDASEPGLFNAQEERVLILSLSDPLFSARAVKRPRQRVMEMIFGPAQNYRLANPRLETLRRTAVMMRCMGYITERDAYEFERAGFSDDHLEMMRGLFSQSSSSMGSTSKH